jgi:hypothetical protein
VFVPGALVVGPARPRRPPPPPPPPRPGHRARVPRAPRELQRFRDLGPALLRVRPRLSATHYQSQWRLNSFLYKDTRIVRRKGMGDLVNAVEGMARSNNRDSGQTLFPYPRGRVSNPSTPTTRRGGVQTRPKRTVLESPILHELVAKHVYVLVPCGIFQPGDDLGDGRVGVGHAFGQGTADLVDELAGRGGVVVEHL